MENSAACRAIENEIECAANTDAKGLITGESGVGKEVVAKLIHHRSRCRRSPLVTINCAGIPDTLLASGTLRHVRGSFTMRIATTAMVPMMPLAPGRLSMTTACLVFSSICLPIRRAVMSPDPPGPNGTMILIGRDGYWAARREDGIKRRANKREDRTAVDHTDAA